MFEKNSNIYIIMCISTAIALFALALDLDYFYGNMLGIVGTIIGSLLIWAVALYIVDKVIEPLELTRKVAMILLAVFLAFWFYIMAYLFYFFPEDLIAMLVAHGVWICISLPLSYFLLKNLSPIRPTRKLELLITLIIFVIGSILIVTTALDNLVLMFLIGGTCIMVYLFWFIFLSKATKPARRTIE
ncbi:MAG: hypothetical protein LUQ65_01895 [Candidatus Helarchaeota archaeon]|nr:hypothetical protein [Candidatus Helarchaeota archaeon]